MVIPPEEQCWVYSRRLTLKPLTHSDAQALYPVLADAALYECTGGMPPDSEAALADNYRRRELRRSPKGDEIWFNWVVRMNETSSAIGYVQATVCSDRASIAWVIGSTWQSRGYGSEAARAMIDWLVERGAPEIEASINPLHLASRKVAERAGLRPTGEQNGNEEFWRLPANPVERDLWIARRSGRTNRSVASPLCRPPLNGTNVIHTRPSQLLGEGYR